MKFGVKDIFSGKQPENTEGKDIILTGIPRSGTTMACRILCEYPDVIALNEPMDSDLFPNREASIHSVKQSFHQFRHSLLTTGKARARVGEGGRIIDNAYSEQDGTRKRVVQREEIRFTKKLSPDFTLVMKHCSEFTMLLAELREIYPCFAMIRNPLAVLNSWATVQIAASRGRISKSDRLNPTLYKALEDLPALLDKQLYILDWYFSQFSMLDKRFVLRYEELIDSNGCTLDLIAGRSKPVHNTLASRNSNRLYNSAAMDLAGETLLKSSGAYWDYYTKSDVEALLNKELNK